MTGVRWTIRELRVALASGAVRPQDLAEEALSRANGNAGHNTYLWQNQEWTLAEAAKAEAIPRGEGGPFGDGRDALWGLPISVKDCFDLGGAPTSCGVRFYRDLNGAAAKDSWLVERLRAAGAVIPGKTHLHPLAYGITGENPEFGDCVQPGEEGVLTGGSSSGAAASVLEGSAVAAIGTDTGGSIRAPAALCGLAGYRASLGRGDWRGGAHLAPSFDTMGCLFRDLDDAPLLGGLFSNQPSSRQSSEARQFSRFAVVGANFLNDCEPEIVAALRDTCAELEALGLRGDVFDAGSWAHAFSIFAPIQAWGSGAHPRGELLKRIEKVDSRAAGVGCADHGIRNCFAAGAPCAVSRPGGCASRRARIVADSFEAGRAPGRGSRAQPDGRAIVALYRTLQPGWRAGGHDSLHGGRHATGRCAWL